MCIGAPKNMMMEWGFHTANKKLNYNRMQVFIVYALSGNCPGVDGCPGKVSVVMDGVVKPERDCQPVTGKVAPRPEPLWRGRVERAARLEEENRLMKEELNELYLKYDRMCAAFGEMNHLVAETTAVAARFAREEEL